MKIFTTIKNNKITYFSIILILFIWEIVSRFVGSEIILPSPKTTLYSVVFLLLSDSFLPTVGYTIVRGIKGFIISFVAGIVLGSASGMNKTVERLLEPIVVIIKSTPIMAIILLALIWFRTENVPVFVQFLIAFPIIYSNVMQGIKDVDTKLIEMARVYGIKNLRKIFELYLPSTYSYIFSGVKTAIGVGFRAVIAAEVLCLPKFAIGTNLQTAKIYLETEYVFAWTIIAIILSFTFERFVEVFERTLVKWK